MYAYGFLARASSSSRERTFNSSSMSLVSLDSLERGIRSNLPLRCPSRVPKHASLLNDLSLFWDIPNRTAKDTKVSPAFTCFILWVCVGGRWWLQVIFKTKLGRIRSLWGHRGRSRLWGYRGFEGFLRGLFSLSLWMLIPGNRALRCGEVVGSRGTCSFGEELELTDKAHKLKRLQDTANWKLRKGWRKVEDDVDCGLRKKS